MNAPAHPANGCDPTPALQTHLAIAEEVLALVTREHEALRGTEPFAAQDFDDRRNSLLPRLTDSLNCLRRTREAWQSMDASARARCPEAEALMRRNQNVIMKIIVLDRENEQALLRRGLLSVTQLPSANSQRPHAVAASYLKHVVP